MELPKGVASFLSVALDETYASGFVAGERSQCGKAATSLRILAGELIKVAEIYEAYASGTAQKAVRRAPDVSAKSDGAPSQAQNRALEWVKKNPGGTSTQARRSGDVRGVGTLYKMALSGKIRQVGAQFFPLEKSGEQP